MPFHVTVGYSVRIDPGMRAWAGMELSTGGTVVSLAAHTSHDGVLMLFSWASVSTTSPGFGKFFTTPQIGTAAAT